MHKTLLAAALATFSLAALPTPSIAQMRDALEVAPGGLDQADVDFMRTADTANIDQMTFANRIAGRSRTQARSLAENVLSSHRKADDALRVLAGAKHVDLEHRMSPRAQEEADDLVRKDVPVDRLFAEDVARDGHDLIALYERTRDESRDPDIRKFADDMLPALRSNTRQAEDLLVSKGVASRD
jgi:predicted outer membrane protein